MRIIRVMSVINEGDATLYKIFGIRDGFAGQLLSLHYSKAILSPLVSQCAMRVCSKKAKQVIIIGNWVKGPKQAIGVAKEQRGAQRQEM